MVNVSDFNKPDRHPFGMLAGLGLSHTCECEGELARMLIKCIEAGKWIDIQCEYTHPSMVNAGLLEEVGDRTYRLTRKAKGLLYSEYGKEEGNE